MVSFVQYLYSRLITKESVSFHCILVQDTDYYLLEIGACAELAWFLCSKR